MIVHKKEGKRVKAYQLGAGSERERQLRESGSIVLHPNGIYELFSQETREKGAQAEAGDYFKVDGSGFPYHNKADYFHANHRPTEEADTYIQIPAELKAWTVEEPECEEITWLRQSGKLTMNEADSASYFSAFLWGTMHYSPKDSVVIFYSVDRDENGSIRDIEFNFVAREEFARTYDIIDRIQ